MPTLFRRPLTPKSYEYLQGTYFYKTKLDRFKNVMREKRCLRCYSLQHRAAACPVTLAQKKGLADFATIFIIRVLIVGSTTKMAEVRV